MVRPAPKLHPVEWAMAGVILMILPAVGRAVDPVQAGQQAFDNIITPFIVFFLSTLGAAIGNIIIIPTWLTMIFRGG